MTAKRIAVLGFSIECNRFAPIAHEQDFRARTWLEGDAMLAEARAPAPRMLAELPGFCARMDQLVTWHPVPILLAMAEPNGPVDHALFQRMMALWQAGLETAPKLDGVYVVLHGAGLTTEDDDPEGTLLTLVRRIVGPGTPVVASFDLHANISGREVAALDGFVGYRTNPHMDMRERGAESADLLHRLMGGTRAHVASVRLPLVPPTVTMLTNPPTPHTMTDRPYGDLIDFGQRRAAEPPYADTVLNVSIMGGFAFSDTPFNGLTAVVTATDAPTAQTLAHELAAAAWAMRHRFQAHLTSLADAVALAKAAACPLAFADVADNPGGGGRGNTTHILRAFLDAQVPSALFGLLWDPALAADAAAAGPGNTFEATLGRNPDDPSTPANLWTVPARVVALHDRPVQGRRGIFAGNTIPLGRIALLELAPGIRVAVASRRVQCADPAFLEALGVDLATVRNLVLKSRGHFRGGFDEYFAPDQIIEVDAPGLTSPMLHRFPWTRLPRPVYPLDADATWPGARRAENIMPTP